MYPHAEVVVLVTVRCQCEMGRARSSGSGEPAPWVSCLARGAPTPLPLGSLTFTFSSCVPHNQKVGVGGLKALAYLLRERKVTSTTSKSRERFLVTEWQGKVKVRRDWPGVRCSCPGVRCSLCCDSKSEVSAPSPRGSFILLHFAFWVLSHTIPSSYQGGCGIAGGVLAVVSQVVPV